MSNERGWGRLHAVTEKFKRAKRVRINFPKPAVPSEREYDWRELCMELQSQEPIVKLLIGRHSFSPDFRLIRVDADQAATLLERTIEAPRGQHV